MKKISILLSFLILVAIFMPFSSVSAATKPGIKPGNFLYFFDTAFEKINLFFIFSPEKKAQKALEYADERLAEAEALTEEKNTNAIKTAVAGYESNIALATEESKQIKDKGKAENLLTSIADNTSKHQEILSNVLSKVPNEAKEAIAKAIEVSRNGREEATKQISELKGEVEESKQKQESQTAQNNQSTEIEKPKKEIEALRKIVPVLPTPKQSVPPTVSNNVQPQSPKPTTPSVETWSELENKYFVEANSKGWATLIITNALGEKRYYKKEGSQWIRKNNESELQQPFVTPSTPSAPQDNSIELKKEILASLQKEINERAQQRKQDINKIIEISNKYSGLIDQRDAEAQRQAEQLKAEYIAKGATFLEETDGTIKPMELLVGQQRMLHSEYYAKLSYIWDRLSVDLQAIKMKLNSETIANWPVWASSPPIVYTAPPKIELFTSAERYIKINTPNGSSNWEITPNGYGGYYMQSYSFGKSMLFNITSMGNGEYYVNNY